MFCRVSMLLLFLFLSFSGNAQVGINTTNPSPAAVLDIHNAQGSTVFGGVLLPRVTLSERANIPATSTDDGMLIFLIEPGQRSLEIFDGHLLQWKTIISMDSNYNILTIQDFDNNTDWAYTLNPSPYNQDNDVWHIVNSLANIGSLGGYFLGCRDLNNPNGGGNFEHQITFDTVDTSSQSGLVLSFKYEIFQFDDGDDVTYEIIFDGDSEGVVTLIDGHSDYSETGTEIINIPDFVNSVDFILSIKQDGDLDMAGFDNFRIYNQ